MLIYLLFCLLFNQSKSFFLANWHIQQKIYENVIYIYYCKHKRNCICQIHSKSTHTTQNRNYYLLTPKKLKYKFAPAPCIRFVHCCKLINENNKPSNVRDDAKRYTSLLSNLPLESVLFERPDQTT